MLNGGSFGESLQSGIIGGVIGGVTAGLANGIGELGQWAGADFSLGLRTVLHGGLSSFTTKLFARFTPLVPSAPAVELSLE